MTTNPRPGWTLSDWQLAYQEHALDVACLFPLVEDWSRNDPAWIQLASSEQLGRAVAYAKQRLDAVGGDRRALPLYGIPFAVKDNIDVVGFETTTACPAYAYQPAHDAEVVARLKRLGAVVVGKTNLDQFATGLVGTRSPYGVVPNTFDSRYICGGSSSGSASVVARGLVPFSLGTDTAGSGRVPAALNNIVGWKPTRGAWSTSGVVPACRTLDCVSVFALTVADAQYIASVAEGFDAADPYSRERPLPREGRCGGRLSVAVPEAPEFFGDDAAREAFEGTLEALQRADVNVQPIRFDAFAELARLLYEGPWVAERLAVVEPLLLAAPNSVEPVVRGIIQQAKQYTAVQTFRVEYRRAALARSIQLALQPFDALVVPTTPTVFTIAEVAADPVHTNARLGTYTNFTNLADLSALAVPGLFRSDGLPAGVTFLAPAWREATLAELGSRLESRLGLPLGATQLNAPAAVAPKPAALVESSQFDLAVVGAHLSGLPLNPQLTQLGAHLVSKTRTSPNYRLYVLPNTSPVKPGMVRDAPGASIEVEVWRLDAESFGRFVATIPSPLGVGNIELEDGTYVKGFLCEPFALRGATEITHLGGFRNYVSSH